MEELDLAAYRELNDSYGRRMVCRIGVDCGLFVEMNYMVDAMLYCLAHRIKFQMYSDDANFGTGVGWSEYFMPFCEEAHEAFHRKFNFHRMPSWRRILKLCRAQRSLCPVAWKIKKGMLTRIGRLVALATYGERVLFAQDVRTERLQRIYVPELGIDDDYLGAFAKVARMVWRLNPYVQLHKEEYRQILSVPPVYSGVQIRGGDKITEAPLVDGKIIVGKSGLQNGGCLFVLTDDYRQFLKARKDFPGLRFLTLCREDERGYYHKQFCGVEPSEKKEAIVRLIVSVDFLLSCRSFVGSITTGPSVFVLKLRLGDPNVQAADCSKDELAATLQLPIDVRSMISRQNIASGGSVS